MTLFARLILAFMIGGLIPTAILAEPPQPTTLHTILKSQHYRVAVGDFVQIRYKTQATAVGIATLDAQVLNNVLEPVGIVTTPLDPAKPEQQLPGAPYFIVALFKVAKPGTVRVTVTPIQNDGGKQNPFIFSIQAQ